MEGTYTSTELPTLSYGPPPPEMMRAEYYLRISLNMRTSTLEPSEAGAEVVGVEEAGEEVEGLIQFLRELYLM